MKRVSYTLLRLGCIEMNPWSSRVQTPDCPDWCIIDLDPDKNTFSQVIEAARVTKVILDALGIPSYCKTSGSTGLHIYIPLAAKYSYEDSKEFGRRIVKVVHAEIPSFTSIERKTATETEKCILTFCKTDRRLLLRLLIRYVQSLELQFQLHCIGMK